MFNSQLDVLTSVSVKFWDFLLRESGSIFVSGGFSFGNGLACVEGGEGYVQSFNPVLESLYT